MQQNSQMHRPAFSQQGDPERKDKHMSWPLTPYMKTKTYAWCMHSAPKHNYNSTMRA